MSGNHRCRQCKLSFESKRKLEAHVIFSHKSQSPSIKKVLILGAGFGGLTVLREIQNKFKNEQVSISIVNADNYFLFTPMLPEVASGMLHPSDVSIPIRNFCNNAKFYQATVNEINLNEKLVTITRTFDGKVHALEYDYLVISIGSKNNFFGNRNVENNCFTIKTVEDAIGLRNHAISMLENAAQTGDDDLQQKFLTFAVIGGGFAGVETIGEMNHFIRESAKHSYPSIDPQNINMVLISSRDGILPEVGKKLGSDALEYLQKVGVRVITNTKAVDVQEDSLELNTGEKIPCTTTIWAGGVAVDPVISSLNCEHGQGGKILVDEFLRMSGSENIFALGDCAAILDSTTGRNYPPTAQHAIREAKTVAANLIESIKGGKSLRKFNYISKGMMATIGNRVGVVSIMGRNLKGASAWFIWRSYYLSTLPTFEKKLKVAFDWTIDLMYKRDLTLVGKIKKKELHTIHIDDVPTFKEQLFADL